MPTSARSARPGDGRRRRARSPLKLRAGLVLGPWTVQKGAWASHVRPVCDHTGRMAVVKVPRNKGSVTRQRFEQEAAGGWNLTQEGVTGILPVLDIDPSDPPGWMVTERAELLAKHLEADGWNFRAAVEAVADVGHTVAALHGRAEPLAHRDLKPDNLFWTESGGPLVGDFGISTWPPRRNLTRQDRKVGPLFYIAPELESYDKAITPRAACKADVYSLAKVMWHLCTRGGHPPQGPLGIGDREAALHEYGGISSRKLRRLIDRATAHRPGERPTMAQFADELDEWLELHPAGSPELEPFDNPRRIRAWPSWVDWDERAWAKGEEGPLRNGVRAVARRIAAALGNTATSFNDANFADLGEDQPRLIQDTSCLVQYPDWEPDAVETATVRHSDQLIVVEAVLDGGTAHYFAELQAHGALVAASAVQTTATVGFPTDFAAHDHLVKSLVASAAQFRA